MEEEIARGQVRGVWWPVFPLPSPAGEDPGTKDPIDEVHAVVGGVDSSTVLKKYSKLKGKASQIMANLLPDGPLPLPVA